MNEAYILKIAGELKIQPRQVTATAKCFAEGATVPFIARYRKEATGSLDEVAVTSIRERLLSLAELDQRRDVIPKSLAERNLLTDQLKSAIAHSETLTALEDIYQPYRPKRRTRATIAKELGLEPLAGLVNVSQLGDRFIKDPSEVVKVQQKVMVTVTEVDLPRKRIALSMKAAPPIGAAASGKIAAAPGRPRHPAPPAKPKAADWFTEALNRNRSPKGN